MARKTPQIGAVIDVEDDPGAAFLGDPYRLALGGVRIRFGEMRAGDEDRARGTDEILGNIVLTKRVVGAIVAIEKEREGFVVLDGEDRKCGQPLRVGDDAARLDAFALKLLADEAAHLFVADACQ